MIRLVILDRDGVLNVDRVDSVKSPAELVMLPGAAEAVAALNRRGYHVAVATNQSVVGRKTITQDTLDEIHRHLAMALAQAGGVLDRIYVAPDHPDHATSWRKPGPGMLLQAMQDFQTLPQQTVMIGDALRDMQAANAAGCHKILVRTGRGAEISAEDLRALQPLRIAADLTAAITEIDNFQA
jgi:D-glycero-D-manno-heptose 1,7-bisphosphate phosphatase